MYIPKHDDLVDFTSTEIEDDEPVPRPTWHERLKEFWDGLIAFCIMVGLMGGFLYAIEKYVLFFKEIIQSL